MRTSNQMAFPDVFKKRNFSISVNDALVDPNLIKPNQKYNGFGTITLKPHQVLNAPKDPGNNIEYGKRTSELHDCWSKTHLDYQGKPIMKLYEDERLSTNIMS